MPKVIATSDLHGILPEIPDCDILIIGGDICPDFIRERYTHHYQVQFVNDGGHKQANWLDTTFREWLEEKVARGIVVVAIAGNHDFVFENTGLWPEDLPWHYLKDELLILYGLKIWGTPWVPNLPSWAFYGSDEYLEARAEAIPTGLDILVSHGPPRGYGDYVAWAGHVGDIPLTKNLTRIAPKTLVCGHIHEGFGVFEHEPSKTVIYNVSLNDECYDPINPVVELEEFREASV